MTVLDIITAHFKFNGIVIYKSDEETINYSYKDSKMVSIKPRLTTMQVLNDMKIWEEKTISTSAEAEGWFLCPKSMEKLEEMKKIEAWKEGDAPISTRNVLTDAKYIRNNFTVKKERSTPHLYHVKGDEITSIEFCDDSKNVEIRFKYPLGESTIWIRIIDNKR